MLSAGDVASLVVAGVHLGILVLEVVFWDTRLGRWALALDPEVARRTRALGANIGLYNGFLAAGLVWGVWLGDAGNGVRVFFLFCVLVAGVFGAATVHRRILLAQALPAAAGLVLVCGWL